MFFDTLTEFFQNILLLLLILFQTLKPNAARTAQNIGKIGKQRAETWFGLEKRMKISQTINDYFTYCSPYYSFYIPHHTVDKI